MGDNAEPLRDVSPPTRPGWAARAGSICLGVMMRSVRRIRTAVSKLPAGCLGMVACVVVIELSFLSLKADLTEISPGSWQYSNSRAVREGNRADILCLGSSLVKFGVLPSVL